jgi:hypothetical protein
MRPHMLRASIAVLVIAALALALATYALRRTYRRREAFNLGRALGGVWRGTKRIGQHTAAVVTGKAPPGASQQGPPPPPPFAPTYSGRVWDGLDWSCPDGTVDTGQEDARACVTSQFHPPVWKAGNDGAWGHNCPNGTTPTPEGQWEKKCEVGYTSRVLAGDKWECPAGTSDTGKDWGNSTWHEAQKQCKRSGAYTLRVQSGDAWVCPPATKDMGVSWGQPNGEKQCKWVAP